MVFILIFSLLLTLVIEVPIAILLGVKDKEDIKDIIIINCITNLSLNVIVYILYFFIDTNIVYYGLVPIFEVIIFIVEGILFKRLKYKKINSYLLSLILNLTSYSIGLLISILMN